MSCVIKCKLHRERGALSFDILLVYSLFVGKLLLFLDQLTILNLHFRKQQQDQFNKFESTLCVLLWMPSDPSFSCPTSRRS